MKNAFTPQFVIVDKISSKPKEDEYQPETPGVEFTFSRRMQSFKRFPA
jgi:hypothetical protein